MKKERIFYLDFVRVISMFIIVTYHFYAHFAENQIEGWQVLSKGIWGIVGVTLFFMISGASLMYNYNEDFSLKKYFKKRFLGIYPMFWIAYILLFSYIFYQTKAIPNGDIPLWRLSISLIGMDGYLSSYMRTFYLIGEWFLGAIILLYVVFPILRWIMKKIPKIAFLLATILNFSILLFCKGTTMPLYQNIITCIYRFWLGMYIIQYLREPKWWYFCLGCLITIALYFIPTNDYYWQVLIANVLGVSLFFVLAYIGKLCNHLVVQNIFSSFSRYSYAIFLVHHYVIIRMENTFFGRHLRNIEVFLLYLVIWIVIFALAKALYWINKNILKTFETNKKDSVKGN